MKFSFSLLRRYPLRSDELLQAWDAADELMLEHVRDAGVKGQRILIVGDRFGALACGLSEHDIVSYTDSYLSYRATCLNSGEKIRPLSRLDELSGHYDVVLARIPKNMSYWEDTLCRLSRHLRPGARLVCGYMVKHQAKAAFDLIEKHYGKTSTSLAKKKARLIFASFEREPIDSPYPLRVKLDGFDRPFTHHSNLFSREKLDIGTRFFLEHIPQGSFQTILDLGCANGVVGIAAKQANPGASLIFSDESRMAILSAEANWQNFAPDAPARFLWTNSYENGEPDSLDLVLCNPPFHQNATVSDQTAWQMFQDSRRTLRRGGLLRVIGNTHLDYGSTLKKIFGGSRLVASNAKFQIVEALK